MRKLCSNGSEKSLKLARNIEEIEATILSLQIDNDSLKKEMQEAKKRQEDLRDQVSEAKFAASLLSDVPMNYTSRPTYAQTTVECTEFMRTEKMATERGIVKRC